LALFWAKAVAMKARRAAANYSSRWRSAVSRPHDRIENDPDRRVQAAIALVFAKFSELQTVRQVHLWMRQERLPLPATEP
jgi:hypothetical protein